MGVGRSAARMREIHDLFGKREASAFKLLPGVLGVRFDSAASGEREKCTEMPQRVCTRGRSLSRCAKTHFPLQRGGRQHMPSIHMPKDAHQTELTACLLRSDRFMTVAFFVFLIVHGPFGMYLAFAK